jgi:hypothetical protein
MFAKTIIDSDAFMDMSLSTQALYFHLSMRGDDDGFINNPKKIQRMIGAADDDLKMLIAKRFIIPFESGIVVIKHWKIHNYIRGDRKKDTVYPEEMALLVEKKNGSYSLKADEPLLTDKCQADDGQVTDKCPHRLGKVKSGKESLGEERVVEDSATATTNDTENDDDENTLKIWGGELGKGVVLLTEKQIGSLLDELGLDGFDYYVEKLADFIVDKGAKVANHYATILKWAREDAKV